MTEAKTISLAAKLAKIGQEIGKIGKTGTNGQQGYKFIEYGTIAGRIRELFDKYQIIIVPSVKDYTVEEISNSRGSSGYHYTLNMHFTVINGENMEEKIESDWLGESADYGDKGINKAETSATKYFLMRLFNISEKDDQEADATSPEIYTQPAQDRPPTQKQLDMIKYLAEKKGMPTSEIMAKLEVVKTAAQASKCIDNLRGA